VKHDLHDTARSLVAAGKASSQPSAAEPRRPTTSATGWALTTSRARPSVFKVARLVAAQAALTEAGIGDYAEAGG
jgi:hypothetical protein